MVKPRPVPAIDAALGLVAVLSHPTPSEPVRAVLLAFAVLCVVVPRPSLRFFMLILGTGGLQGLATLGLGAGFYPETDFAPFLVAGVLWAVLASGFPRHRRGAAYVVGLGALGFAAVSMGYLSLWFLDRLVIPLGQLFLLELSDRYRGLHLAAVGGTAVVLFLVLWSVFTTRARRGSEKPLTFADGYLACRRELSFLGKRWHL